jgi:hypothetical protein
MAVSCQPIAASRLGTPLHQSRYGRTIKRLTLRRLTVQDVDSSTGYNLLYCIKAVLGRE